MDHVKKYTFEATVQTMSFFQKGEGAAWGFSEEDARERLTQKLCNVHRIGRNCLNVGQVIKIEH